jgi:hypothetical protein
MYSCFRSQQNVDTRWHVASQSEANLGMLSTTFVRICEVEKNGHLNQATANLNRSTARDSLGRNRKVLNSNLGRNTPALIRVSVTWNAVNIFRWSHDRFRPNLLQFVVRVSPAAIYSWYWERASVAHRKINLYKSECIYVCMFRHNYLSVDGIVSFPSLTWLYKYKEEYRQGEMWHSAQRAEISEKIFVPAWPLPENGYVTHIRGNQQWGIVDS